MPELQCAGVRFSQALSMGSRRSRDVHSSAASGEQSTGHASSDVSDETWALICAGQLSMIVPPGAPFAPAAASSTAAAGAPAFSSGGSPLAAFRVRCAGLSVRLDTVEAESEQRAQASGLGRRSLQGVDAAAARSITDESPQIAETVEKSPPNSAEEWSQTALNGARAVASRASLIVTSVRGAAGESGPRQFATKTEEAAGRICWQAMRIVKRSAEQVGRVATLPWRGFGGGDSDVST